MIGIVDVVQGFDTEQIDRGMIYYTAEYGRFLKALLQSESYYIAIGDPQTPSGLLPIMVKSGSLGTVANALPFFGSHGAPVAAGHDNQVLELLCKAESLAKQLKWDSLTIVENPESPLSESVLAKLQLLRTVDTRISQVTHLSGAPPLDLEQLLGRFHVKMRNAVRKGVSTGQIVIKSTDQDSWDFLVREHQQQIRERGGVPKTRVVFDLLQEHLRDKVRMHCGYVDNQIVSALVTIRYGSTVEYFTPVVSHEFRSRQVLPHLIAEVMLRDFRSGATKWNWGGTWETQVGVRRFKSRFAASENNYRYLHWAASRFESHSQETIFREYPYWYVRKF